MIPDTTIATVALVEEARVDARLFALLVMHFGTPQEIVASPPADLMRLKQVSERQAEAISGAGEKLDLVAGRLEKLALRGIHTLSFFDTEYPESLRGIAEPPPFFYLRGTLPATERRLAVIGGPDADAAAIADAVALGKQLAVLKIGVVAPLEPGVTAGAHLGAMAAGGAPLAVLGSGLDRIEPAEHATLAQQIAGAGGVLSPHAPGARPTRARADTGDAIVCAFGQAAIVLAPEGDAPRLSRATESTLHLGHPVFVLARERTPAVSALFALGAYPLLDPGDIEAALRFV